MEDSQTLSELIKKAHLLGLLVNDLKWKFIGIVSVLVILSHYFLLIAIYMICALFNMNISH